MDPATKTAPEGVVLQQFEEHGGVLYKVYVLGSTCEVKLRPSLQLPVEARNSQSCRSGWIVLPRFSTTPVTEDSSAPYSVTRGESSPAQRAEAAQNDEVAGSSPSGICTLFLHACIALWSCNLVALSALC